MANPEFNAWNLVLALSEEASLELFFRITETLADGDRNVPIEKKVEVPHVAPPEPPLLDDVV